MLNVVRYFAEVSVTPFAQYLFDVGAKATVLLLAAMAGTLLLRRSSAAVRHRIWCLTFAALVLLPGLSAALPEWRLAVLPYSSPLAPREVSHASAAQAASTPFATETVDDPLALGSPLAPQADRRGALSDEQTVGPGGLSTRVPLAEQAGYETPLHGEPAATLWLVGAMLALVPLLVALIRTFFLRRHAQPICDASWTNLLDELCRLLGLSRQVGLYETEVALMPMTWGVLRPVVMLPDQARDWTDRLRRFVLLHELAHVKRCDVGYQLLGRVVCALYWFHPLAWYALRRLRIERELACDDCVVLAGERATDYAAELLQIAHSYRPIPFAAAVAMAQRSNLEHRLTALFDRACSHLPVSARTARLLLAGVLALVGTVAAIRLAPRVTADDVAQPENPLAGAAGSTDIDDLITVSGKVVDPEGQPFAGAKLYAVRWYWEPHIPHPPLAETTTDADGRFTISYRKSQFTVDVGRLEQWKEVAIVATSDGFGSGWVTWRDIPRGEEPTLRLVTDDVPIAGLVVDLEGKPVAGVTVRVGTMHTGKGGNLDGWLEAVRHGEFPWTAVKHLNDDLPQFDGWQPRIVTNNDGRFRVNGLGRERRVDLSFSGPTIAYQEVEAVTRRSDMFPLKFSRSEKEFNAVYGAEFELVVPPTQPITGIVRDAETRQPLAGVSIESNMFSGSNFINTRQLRAVSDEQGRYRLVGMPKGTGNRMLAVPSDDQPYLMRDIKVPDLRGLEPVDIDIELHRGVWITGRITDLRTGEPVVARLHYLPFLSNDYAQRTPEFGEPRTADGFEDRYVSRPDGSYRLVGLPGRAIVGVECMLGHYRKGVGAESIAGMDKYGRFDTYPNPVQPGQKWPSAMKEINPSPEATEVVCDLALDPGGKVRVNVVDPDGEPLDDFETQGSGHSWTDSRNLHANFDVITLGPEEIRTVIIRHKERKLGKAIRVRLAEYPSGSLSITVEPMATIIGRLVDRQGTPISGAAIEAWILPTEDFSERLPSIATDAQGGFEYTHVPIGCHYNLSATAAGLKQPGQFAKDIAVEPGETKDLGEVVYGGAVQGAVKKPADEKAAASETAEEKIVRGRVLLPDGKPAVGAHLAVIGNRKKIVRSSDYYDRGPEVLAEAEVDEKGEYVLRLPGVSEQTHSSPRLIARQDGCAITWHDIHFDAAETQADFKLKPEVPLRVKLVDLEGQPGAGVRVSIASVVAEQDERELYPHGRYRDQAPAAWIAPITSDDQGTFVIHGLAADQGVMLDVPGDDRFARQDIALNTGMPEERGGRDGSYRPLVKNAQPGVEVVLALSPAQVFEGTVRYADSGDPVPHARLEITARQQENGSMMSVDGSADEQGHYRISPRPGIGFGLTAHPPAGTPYLARRSKAISWKGGESVKKIDMTLPRGVLVRGTVVERGTDARVAGAAVQYHPESANNRNESNDIVTGWQCVEVTDALGRFAIAVLPGPGRLLVNGPQGKYVLREIGNRELGLGKPGGRRYYVHAFAKLDPEAGDGAVEVKVELQPGAAAMGRIVDEAGKAIDEVLVISRLNIWPVSPFWRGPTTPTRGGRFELTGLAEGVEYPIYFLDQKRRLGASEVIKAGDSERTVVLKPCGKATLRLIDGKGEPVPANYGLTEMVVTPGPYHYDRDALERGELTADADFVTNIDRTNNPFPTHDDENGTRTLKALIPGATYRVVGKRDGELRIVKEFQVKPNETVDFGDITVER